MTPKESWRDSTNLDRLKEGLLQFQNLNRQEMCPQTEQEHKEIVDNFDRLRRSILRHKESNRNLCLPTEDSKADPCVPETGLSAKMYNVASMEFKKGLDSSTSKARLESEVSEFISMPLTERSRHAERSSKERKSSHRKKSRDMCHCRRHPQK